MTNRVQNQMVELPSNPERPPVWTSKEVKQFHNLSDVRHEQTAVYWLWRRHGVLKAGEAATMIQALGVIKGTLEAERQVEVEKLRAEVADLRAELERQEQLRVVNPVTVQWQLAQPSSAQN